jgi:hypothetical protein
MDVQLQIPDDVARVIQNQQPDLFRAALQALALEGYRTKRLSEGQVRRMQGHEIPSCVPRYHTSKPIDRISSRALLFCTTPGRMR